MSITLRAITSDEIYDATEDGGSRFVNIPVPETAKRGVYVLHPTVGDQSSTVDFSFVSCGNDLVRVPLSRITPAIDFSGMNYAPATELSYLLCGFDIVSKLVSMQSWPRWPEEFLLLYLADQPDVVLGVVVCV